MCFRIERKVFSWFSEFKAFDELVFIQNQMGLTGAPSGCDVLYAFADEDKLLWLASLLLCISVDESFDVELAEDELLSGLAVADHAHVLVDLSILVLLLWQIRGRVLLFQETAVEDEGVCSPAVPRPGSPIWSPLHVPIKNLNGAKGSDLAVGSCANMGTIRVTIRIS